MSNNIAFNFIINNWRENFFPALLRIGEILRDSHVVAEMAKKFLDLLKICPQVNVYQFQYTVYRFSDGSQMGSLLALLIAEVFMNKFEMSLTFLNSIPEMKCYYTGIVTWTTLCLYRGNEDQLLSWQQELNSHHNNIEFTTEAGGSTINFLDLKISSSIYTVNLPLLLPPSLFLLCVT